MTRKSNPAACELHSGQQAYAALCTTWNINSLSITKSRPFTPASVPALSHERRLRYETDSVLDAPSDPAYGTEEADPARSTVLYLAYGSNLCAETFQGVRGIKPLSQMNVLVPSLRLTFDLPGVPYSEPCFANSGVGATSDNGHYHKDRWQKGLVGVVYEVTKADYAIIIATEGGGASYQDIVVDCYEIPQGTSIIDPKPSTPALKTHTLFSPMSAPGSPPPKSGGRVSRPDPGYAQPSARYLKLITDGAAEHDMPLEYREFLAGLRPYTVTTQRQRIGQFIFLSVWMPLVLAIFSMSKTFADDKGRIPPWLVEVMAVVFKGMWGSYDLLFKPLFGDGERTVKGKSDDVEKGTDCYHGDEFPFLSKHRQKDECGTLDEKLDEDL